MKVKSYYDYIRESADEETKPVESPIEEKREPKKFHLSEELLSKLKKIEFTPIAKGFISLSSGVDPKYLVQNPIDYLSVEKDGNISYLKPQYFSDEEDPWTSKRRVLGKPTRIIRDIYNEEILARRKQTDIEQFANLWSDLDVDLEIRVLRGDDILRAYNYTKELDKSKFGFTCANFHQGNSGYAEPNVSDFDIYTKNPKNIGTAVIIVKGRIVGRITFAEGTQLKLPAGKDNSEEGKHRICYGNYYGEKKGGSYESYLKKYLESKGGFRMATSKSPFLIKLENTRFKYYCPFDSMYVNFQLNQLSDTPLYGFVGTYHASCPSSLIGKKD